MTSELLEKEDEYYKENEKLKLKTKELLTQVNDVMKIQDNLIRETFNTKTEISVARKFNFVSNLAKTSSDVGLKHSNEDAEDLGFPCSVNEMGVKGANHFYRAKIKTLQGDFHRLEGDFKKKCEELKKIHKEHQHLVEEKEKWFLSHNTSKNIIGKLETQNLAINSKLQTKDNENGALKKEIEQLKKEVKNLNLNLNALELRLNRSYEENEKLKASVKTSKDEEKELKEAHRKQINNLNTTVKHIEKHRMELLSGFKKQMQLIDNLKKQKVQIQTLKAAELMDAEYLKILDFKSD